MREENGWDQKAWDGMKEIKTGKRTNKLNERKGEMRIEGKYERRNKKNKAEWRQDEKGTK